MRVYHFKKKFKRVKQKKRLLTKGLNFYYSNRDMSNPISRLWNYISVPTRSRTFGLLALLIVVAAIPLTVFIAQKQQEIRQRAATTNGTGTCRDLWPSETVPSSGNGQDYYWKADCSTTCTSKANCAQNSSDQCNVNPNDSNWCYGFEDGWKCLQQRHLSAAGNKASDSYGNCTVGCPGGVCGGGTVPACDKTAVNMNVSPGSAAVGANMTFTVSGSQGSTHVGDTWTGGVDCAGGFWDKKTCKATAPGSFTWTHSWKNCKPNNTNDCPVSCTSDPKSYTVTRSNVTPPPGGGNTNLYVDPSTIPSGGKATVIATGITDCASNISINAGAGLSCPAADVMTCDQPNPKNDGKPCWWRWPNCTARTAGTYNASFNADGTGCAITKQYTIGQTTTPSPTPGDRLVTFSINPSGGFVGTKVTFSAVASGAPVLKYEWFARESGDPHITTVPNYIHTYSKAGVFDKPAVRVTFKTIDPKTGLNYITKYANAITITPSLTVTVSPSPTPPAGNTALSFNLTLKGIGANPTGGNPNPVHRTKNISVCIYNLKTDPTGDKNCAKGVKKEGQITYNSTTGNFVNANFNIGTITTGQYNIFVKTNKYLRKRIPLVIAITSGRVNPIPNTTLLLGDINGDNQIDIQDYEAYRSCIGKTPNTPTCENADLNDDGKNDTPTNMTDYRWLFDAFKTRNGD